MIFTFDGLADIRSALIGRLGETTAFELSGVQRCGILSDAMGTFRLKGNEYYGRFLVKFEIRSGKVLTSGDQSTASPKGAAGMPSCGGRV